MIDDSVSCLGPHGFHPVAFRVWGAPDNPKTLICSHALTRNSRDFDFLATALKNEYRVVCPDMPGRGASPPLAFPEDYNYAVYAADMACLLARLNVSEVDWVGTSMGGLIGMVLAAQPGNPIRKLVINDIGPYLPKAALQRIASYLGKDPVFKSLDDVEGYLREIHKPFGPLTDDQWRHLAESSYRVDGHGAYRLSYDPAIAVPFKQATESDINLWAVWEAIGKTDILVLRGEESDILSEDTARQMTERGPGCELVTLEGIGHAPVLMSQDQIDIIASWLGQNPTGNK